MKTGIFLFPAGGDRESRRCPAVGGTEGSGAQELLLRHSCSAGDQNTSLIKFLLLSSPPVSPVKDKLSPSAPEHPPSSIPDKFLITNIPHQQLPGEGLGREVVFHRFCFQAGKGKSRKLVRNKSGLWIPPGKHKGQSDRTNLSLLWITGGAPGDSLFPVV